MKKSPLWWCEEVHQHAHFTPLLSVCLLSSFDSDQGLQTQRRRKMASSFTRLISGRNTAALLASLGAGTVATGFLLSDSSLAAEAKKKLYPPR